MEPLLQPGNFVFATVPLSDTTFLSRLLQSHSFEMLFRESEGWTLIAEQASADALGLESIFPCRKVTLGVHSSLDAVGFLAAITTRLAESGLGINPVSGFYHDHLYVTLRELDRRRGFLLTAFRFVPEGKHDEVVNMLIALAEECKADASRGSVDE
jgi:hypothetical protein